ncbi:hypothetical protein Pyn_38024 [Prunus yedoensis var. nudiflora]|uniref:F-box protein n=1 Tax=Prunus yedoensis var. nudiflora TaxID=2094558 RepID=A0A314V4R9_PRUYE|nr:hypothetical protein Pyn_38024 [Prunus yedoensis var. nudiflora]
MSLQLPVISEATAEQKLFVVGACNDLVLCCPSKLDHHEYYICNPYTKKWVAVPPPPRIHNYVSVGFICDPYYNYNSSSSFDNDVCINAEYIGGGLCDYVQSSMWTSSFLRPVNGESPLMWYAAHESSDTHTSSYILELDPFQGISNINTSNGDGDGDHIIVDKCRFSLAPLDMSSDLRGYSISMYQVLGACRGHLRVSEFVLGNHLSVWELDAGDDNLKWRLVVDQVPFFQMDSSKFEDPLMPQDHLMPQDEWLKSALGFHPDIEAIYVDARKIVRCNFGARMLELVPEIPSRGPDWHLFYIHPFVLPWWPTPVPSL